MLPMVIDISAFLAPVTDTVTALTTAVPTLVTSVAVITGGLIAIRVGFRIVRSLAK